jgi:hypothetical protein
MVEQEADDVEEVYGSGDSYSRILERVYKVLLTAMSDIKTATFFNNCYAEDQCLATISLINYNNPYLVVKGLQILKKATLALAEPLQMKMVYLKKNVFARYNIFR